MRQVFFLIILYAHHSLIQGNRAGVLYGLFFTIALAIIFTRPTPVRAGEESSLDRFSSLFLFFLSSLLLGPGVTSEGPSLPPRKIGALTQRELKLLPTPQYHYASNLCQLEVGGGTPVGWRSDLEDEVPHAEEPETR